MPQWLDDGLDDADGARLPGVYEKLLRRRCEHETAPDPRLILDPELVDEFRALEAEGRVLAEKLIVERLASGEPLRSSGREVVGGRAGMPREQAPEWLREARSVLVHADDTITPV